MNDEFKELLSPQVRERAYKAVVATSKERVVKGWALRMYHQGRWTLDKLTNPIDDPQQFKKGYPATDDPTAEAGPVAEVQRLSPERSKTAPATIAPEVPAATGTTATATATSQEELPTRLQEVTKTLSEMASEEVEEFLSGIGKELFPDPAQRSASPAKSSSGSDRTQSSREDWPETAKERHERMLKETERMEKKQKEQLEKQAKMSAKTPGKGSSKSPRAGKSRESEEPMDTGEGTSKGKGGSKKGSKGGSKSKEKKPAQTPLGMYDPQIPAQIVDVCLSKVPT